MRAVPMRYVVFGAGAIGGVVGGRLAQAGLRVELIARGAHLGALQAHGLRLESPAGTDTVRVSAVGHPRELDWHDNRVVLLAVKSQHTVAALGELARFGPPQTPIVCLQNGIANEPAALRYFPNVQAVSVACPTSHLAPGVVQAWSTPVTGLLDIGRYPNGIDEVSEAVAADFRAATFSSHPDEAVGRWKNRKLLTAPATSRRTTSTARSSFSGGCTALRHRPMPCSSDWHATSPSHMMLPARFRRQSSLSDSRGRAVHLHTGPSDFCGCTLSL